MLILVALFAPISIAQADFRTGDAAFKAKNYADAYLQLLPAARAGNAQAQFMLGQLSDNGWGPVALDPREAARWYRLAAERGHGEAQFTLAGAYALGRGVPQNPAQALTWLTRAADSGHEQAILDLGRLYDEGRGVPRDEARATNLYARAATLGNPEGQFRFGERLESGLGIDQDKKAAWGWIRRAADGGHPPALYRIGRAGPRASNNPEQNIATYVWLALAEQLGDGDVKREAGKDRAEVAKNMTPGDIAAATARVKAWKPLDRTPAAPAGS